MRSKIIADLAYYYEVDVENCQMTHMDWIEEVADALTDPEYLSKLTKELKEYKEQREQ